MGGRLRAVGYVRVSTDQQAMEGVSLDAQQVRIRAHCVSQDIELVDIVIDEGFSAKSLERPGIKRALAMLASNQANALVVVKLDRLTRSVKDLGFLCDSYFREGLPYSLLSVSDSIDTRSASGKLMLNVLMSVAQWEREAISERTQEAMNELKRRGVRMGGAPYGWQYTKEPDEHGRRNIVIHPSEQKVIQRICAMHRDGLSVLDIAKRLTADGVRPRGTEWERPTLYRILERAGLLTLPRRPKKESGDGPKKQGPTRDKTIAIKQAHTLRAQGLSLRQIGEKLRKDKILPARGEVWHAASVLDLLRHGASTG
ncbi:MAG: recombinase family protein [Myxococcales bacterium]|nr:recombinase family protein [Myxococcales bacterium]